MSKQMVRIWVHPNFKKKLKVEAAQKDMGVLNYTQMLSSNQELTDSAVLKTKKIKRRGFDFGF